MARNLSKYISSIGRLELSKEKECQLVKVYQNKEVGWQEAQDKIIRNNMLHVVKLAIAHSKNENIILELISEGNLALLQSLNSFDPNRETKLSTYSTIRIKGAFYSFFKSKSTLRHFKLSDGNLALAKKAKDYIEKLELEGLRKPSALEIARHCEIDYSKALLVVELAQASAVSIDAEIDIKENSKTLEIADSSVKTPFTETKDKENSAIIEKIIASLPLKNQIIVNKRFGLQGEDRTGLALIGKELNLTKERVRQIEKKSLQLIRNRLKKME